MKNRSTNIAEDLRPEYNFDYSKAVRGKYFKRLLEEGANVVVLEPDVAKAFGNSAAVNDALRSLLDRTVFCNPWDACDYDCTERHRSNVDTSL